MPLTRNGLQETSILPRPVKRVFAVNGKLGPKAIDLNEMLFLCQAAGVGVFKLITLAAASLRTGRSHFTRAAFRQVLLF